MRERAPPGEGIICLVFFVAAGYSGKGIEFDGTMCYKIVLAALRLLFLFAIVVKGDRFF